MDQYWAKNYVDQYWAKNWPIWATSSKFVPTRKKVTEQIL